MSETEGAAWQGEGGAGSEPAGRPCSSAETKTHRGIAMASSGAARAARQPTRRETTTHHCNGHGDCSATPKSGFNNQQPTGGTPGVLSRMRVQSGPSCCSACGITGSANTAMVNEGLLRE